MKNKLLVCASTICLWSAIPTQAQLLSWIDKANLPQPALGSGARAKVSASIQEHEQRVLSYAVEEIKVAEINKKWGFSDEVARKWVKQYLEAKKDGTPGSAPS